MKKQIKAALKSFLNKNMCVCRLSKKEEVKNEIRAIADNYTNFNNLVFELGCEVLAKKYLKEMNK